MTDDVCNKYTIFYSEEGRRLKCEACNDYDIFKPNLDVCKKLCMENAGLCDDSSLKYCLDHPEDPYCACINDQGDTNPLCTNATCRSSGYATSAMKAIDCIINSCKVSFDFDNIRNLDINNLNIDQNCAGEEEVSGYLPTKSEMGPISYLKNLGAHWFTMAFENMPISIILIGSFFLLLFILFVY